MKPCTGRVLLPLLVSSLLSFAVSADDVPTTTIHGKINKVLVYPNTAEVIRDFSVSVSEGNQRIVVTELPPSVREFTTRIVGATPDVRITGVSKDIQSVKGSDPRVNELLEKIERLEDQVGAHKDTIQTLELQLSFIERIVESDNMDVVTKLMGDQAGLSNVLERVHQNTKSLLTSTREVKDAKQAAEQEIGKARIEIQRIRAGEATEWASLELDVYASAPQQLQLEVSYLARDVNWNSTYRAHLYSDSAQLLLNHDITLTQHSPEGWEDVQLVFSTATPATTIRRPRPQSVFVDLEDVLQQSILSNKSIRVTGNYARRSSFDQADALTISESGPTTRTYAYSALYGAPGRHSVPRSSEQTEIRGIAHYEFDDVSVNTKVMPRHNQSSFLTAEFNYEGTSPLPGGTLKAFVDGSFVGSTSTDDIFPDTQVELPMGVNRNVVVTVKEQGGQESDSGFLRNRITEETHFLVEVVNNGSVESNVQVLDYYPVSRHEDVRVEPHPDATPPTEENVDDQPGRVVWSRLLAAGETWVILQRYSISYPDSKRIIVGQG